MQNSNLQMSPSNFYETNSGLAKHLKSLRIQVVSCMSQPMGKTEFLSNAMLNFETFSIS